LIISKKLGYGNSNPALAGVIAIISCYSCCNWTAKRL